MVMNNLLNSLHPMGVQMSFPRCPRFLHICRVMECRIQGAIKDTSLMVNVERWERANRDRFTRGWIQGQDIIADKIETKTLIL